MYLPVPNHVWHGHLHPQGLQHESSTSAIQLPAKGISILLWHCVDSTLVSSQSLTCTDLLSCSWPIGGTNYLVWYQKNLSRRKPILGGTWRKQLLYHDFITTSYTCSQTSNIQRSTQRDVPEHVSLRVGTQQDPQQSKQACIYYLFGIQITRFKFRCALFRRGSEVLMWTCIKQAVKRSEV